MRSGPPHRSWPALAALLAAVAAFRLAPFWTGYRRVWGDQDSWLHLYLVERLHALGPLAALSAFWRPELTQPSPHRLPWPPLLHIASALASYPLGVEWAVRLAPVVAGTLAVLWLYWLARDWNLSPAGALLAAALTAFSPEMIRFTGLHFLPQALSPLLAIGLIRSAYRLAHAPRPAWTSIAALALWTSLTIVGYSPNMFHVELVVAASLTAEAAAGLTPRLRHVALATAAGVVLALPYLILAGRPLQALRDYPVPPWGGRWGDVARYPILIGPVAVVLALAAVPRLAAAARRREAWAIWLAVWIGSLAPQLFVWIFPAPGPPPRLLILAIPGLALAAGAGGGGGRRAAAGLAALIAAAFLAGVELPRRRVSDGEAALYQAAARLAPAGATVCARWNNVFWYYCREPLEAGRWHVVDPRGASEETAGTSMYWIIADRERERPRSGRVLWEQAGNQILLTAK